MDMVQGRGYGNPTPTKYTTRNGLKTALAPSPQGEAELVSEARRRIQRAELDRNRHASRMADCYRFALPWRHKVNSTAAAPSGDLDEIFDSTAMTVVEDFAADMLNTFTPMRSDWVDIRPAVTLDKSDNKLIATQLKDYQAVLFDSMARSNLYQALQESYLDLSVGTMGLMVKDINPAEPLHCQAIPVTELLIDRGPWGGVDGRWRKWKVRAEEVGVLWPEASPMGGVQWAPGDVTEHDIIDGMWRDWTNLATEAWRYVVLCNDKIIYQERYSGTGSCAMIIARWSRDSTTAWGVGPLYRSTPDVKTINHVKFLLLKQLDKVVDPPSSYEDDGVINIDQGVTPGMWIPRAVGSEAPQPIESKSKFDVAWLQADDLKSSIRRAHYQDRPEQKGKTPPSASQWADEAAERARRMGSPATNLVQELQYPLIRRFAYLETKRGTLPKIELNGREIAVVPVSPLLRAQEQEEVVRLDRFAEMIGVRFGPQMANVIINQIKFAHKLADLLGVDPNLLRSDGEVKAAIAQFASVVQGQAGATQQAAPAAPAGPQA